MKVKRDRSNVKRISNNEIALELGLELKQSRRYTLNKEQLKRFQELTHYTARKSSELDNADFATTTHYWIKEKGLSRFVKVNQEETALNINDITTFISK